MSARQLAVDVLVVLAVGIEVLCCLALLAFRDVFDRLHYATAATTLPPPLLAAAVLVEEGWSAAGIEALVSAAFLFVLGPVAAVAVARAARLRVEGRIAIDDEWGEERL